eukprot:scaffold282330_cov33-Tisochrysis_lutea.AAC.3
MELQIQIALQWEVDIVLAAALATVRVEEDVCHHPRFPQVGQHSLHDSGKPLANAKAQTLTTSNHSVVRPRDLMGHVTPLRQPPRTLIGGFVMLAPPMKPFAFFGSTQNFQLGQACEMPTDKGERYLLTAVPRCRLVGLVSISLPCQHHFQTTLVLSANPLSRCR